jgi:hypothetical protein
MPDEEQKQSPQQSPEGDSAGGENSTNVQEARDAEILIESSGARPSPNPDSAPQPSGPINKSADLTDVARSETPIVGDTLSAAQTEAPPASPSPSDSSGQEGSQGE